MCENCKRESKELKSIVGTKKKTNKFYDIKSGFMVWRWKITTKAQPTSLNNRQETSESRGPSCQVQVIASSSLHHHSLIGRYGVYMYMSQITTTICSVCRNHNLALSPFITHHLVCEKSNTTGTTCGAGIAYPYLSSPSVISELRVARSFYFLWNVL